MARSSFSTGWKRSTERNKQRKYRYNAPLHLRQKFVHVHLSKDLQKKYDLKNVQISKGDKVKVMRGQFAKKEGKVDHVNLKKEKVFVTGVEVIKKEGTRILFPLSPSNLMITELNLNSKNRKNKIAVKKNVTGTTSETSSKGNNSIKNKEVSSDKNK